MKKIMRCALLSSIIILLCIACEKEEPNELLQTEHIPGIEEAVVHTPTAIPSPTATQTPTPQEDAIATQVPTVAPATPTPTLTPIPTLPAEEPAFMDMYRAMPTGVRVNTEGIPEEEIRFCFCDIEITNRTRTAFSGQAGLDWTAVRTLAGIRVLYYRGDGKLYTCDIIADEAERDVVLNEFYRMYQSGQKTESLMPSLPETLVLQGYQTDTLSAGNVSYLYIYK